MEKEDTMEIVIAILAITAAIIYAATLTWAVLSDHRADQWQTAASEVHETYAGITEQLIDYILEQRGLPEQLVDEVQYIQDIDQQITQALEIANDNQDGDK